MLRILKVHADEMVAHALADAPNECCGILAGTDNTVLHAYRIANTDRSPYSYLMDPQEQLNAMLDAERNGWDLLSFYHSHVDSPAYPSQTDVKLAVKTGWVDVIYVVLSLANKADPEMRAFRIDKEGGITEIDYDLA